MTADGAEIAECGGGGGHAWTNLTAMNMTNVFGGERRLALLYNCSNYVSGSIKPMTNTIGPGKFAQ